MNRENEIGGEGGNNEGKMKLATGCWLEKLSVRPLVGETSLRWEVSAEVSLG